MRIYKSLAVWGVVSAALLFGAVGACTESQLQRGDRVVADANHVGQAIRGVAASPAGTLIPDSIRAVMELLGIGAAAAVIVWQRIRASSVLAKSQDKSTTLSAIADAIDSTPDAIADAAKNRIEAVMKDREILSLANAVVDEHRSKLTS